MRTGGAVVRRSTALAWGTFAALLVGAIGLAAGSLVAPREPSTTSGAAELTAEVTTSDLADVSTVAATRTADAGSPIVSPAEGILTRAPTVGGRIEPGAVAFSVDDRPVIAVVGEVPFWRDLAVGDRGPDVSRLRSWLGVSQAPLVAADEFDPGALRSLNAWRASVGVPPADSFFSREVVVGRFPLVVDESRIAVGQRVSVGDVLATTRSATPVWKIELTAREAALTAAGTSVRGTGRFSAVSGSVQAVSEEADPSDPSSRRLVATVDLLLPASAGTAQQVNLVLREFPAAISVPIGAVTASDRGDVVRVRSRGVTTRRSVDVAAVVDGRAVVSRGLSSRETVVIGG